MAMRGVETRIQEIRHRIFTEVARMAYHTEWPTDRRIEALPFDIMPGEVGNIRNDIFLERAIVGERLRLAMGLPCRSAAEHAPLSDNIEAATREETYYTPPVLNVRFLPYISGSGSVCGLSYSATIETIAFGRAHSHARRKLSSEPATSQTTSAPPCGLLSCTNSCACSGVMVSTSG